MHAFFLLLLSALAATPPDKVADAAFQKHEWAKAAEAYQKRTQTVPEDGLAWLRLGISLVHLERGKEAVAPLEKAEKLGVQPGLVRYQLAQAAALAGDKGRALGLLHALVDEDYYPVGLPAAKEKAFASLLSDSDFAQLSAALEVNRAPCKQGEAAQDYRQLDFWLGDWDVVDGAGDAVGSTHMERILAGCVLYETWRGEAGGEGRSLMSWNPGLKHWEQYWADGQGVPIFFTGRLENGELRLRADSATRRGVLLVRRVTVSKLPDGRVRQLSEASTDAGRTWSVEYDFYYVRKAPPR
jgi:hypothetical protein